MLLTNVGLLGLHGTSSQVREEKKFRGSEPMAELFVANCVWLTKLRGIVPACAKPVTSTFFFFFTP